MKHLSKRLLLIIFMILFISLHEVKAQVENPVNEPSVENPDANISSLQNQYGSAFGFNILMNNFGFGAGVEYRKIVAPESEFLATLRITGLRDASEQTFTDVFFGQQIIPNKFQRAFAFPLLIGIRKRLFSDIIQQNYRFFVSASGGGVMAYSYPYFDDINNNGYREQFQTFFEPVNDIFTGLSEGEWHTGATGEFKLALDIGGNFTRLSSIEFGYYFYYFPDGIQLMMPNQPKTRQTVQPGQSPFIIDEEGQLVLEPFYDDQKFFGTPQITFTFGWLW